MIGKIPLDVECNMLKLSEIIHEPKSPLDPFRMALISTPPFHQSFLITHTNPYKLKFRSWKLHIHINEAMHFNIINQKHWEREKARKKSCWNEKTDRPKKEANQLNQERKKLKVKQTQIAPEIRSVSQVLPGLTAPISKTNEEQRSPKKNPLEKIHFLWL